MSEETPTPEYKRVQRACEFLYRRTFCVKDEFNKPGQIITDHGGRQYEVQPNGSWKRVKR